MAFNSVTIGASVFNSIGNGLYQLSTVAFGAAGNMVKITGGKRSSKTAPTSASVSRHLEKDIVTSGVTERRKCSVVLQLSVPEGFTTTEVDGLVSDINTFVDATTLTRILMGES